MKSAIAIAGLCNCAWAAIAEVVGWHQKEKVKSDPGTQTLTISVDALYNQWFAPRGR